MLRHGTKRWASVLAAVALSWSAAGIAQAVQKAVASVDSRLVAARVVSMEQLLSEAIAQPRFNTVLLSVYAALARVLAAVGIYGVISYTVVQNTREIGIRMALGADQRSVLAQVLGQGLKLTAVGAAAGLAGAYALSTVVASLLFGVQPTDPLTIAAVIGTIGLVASLACLIPAYRASRVDPLVVLRDE